MSLALAHCWKEWRAQRPVLVAFFVLAMVSLCLVFLLVPDHWWDEAGRRALSLSWFVAAGVVGVVAFAAPALVRSEFGAKDDQFVRRLPGALGVSFSGKLLFFVLATAALPLLGLAVGELSFGAIGRTWDDLFEWEEALGKYRIEWPWPAVLGAYGLLLAPWVWAVGTWLPGGRMAIGGTAVLGLVLGLCITAVLRQCPQLEMGLDWRSWLWFVAPAGVLVAMVSWAKGRRGGGAMRSARFGLAAFAVTLVPPGTWLGSEVFRYHNPDPRRFEDQSFRVDNISADQRFVLARATEHSSWPTSLFRIDLQTGTATQVGGVHQFFTGEPLWPNLVSSPSPGRYWATFEWDDEGSVNHYRVLDLETGEWTPIEGRVVLDRDRFAAARLPAELCERVVADTRRNTGMRGPGGRTAWMERDALQVAETNGTVTGVSWPSGRERWFSFWPAGHGIVFHGRKGARSTFDLTTLEFGPSVDDTIGCYFVRGALLVRGKGKAAGWSVRERDGSFRGVEGLRDCAVLGLFDDDSLLCAGNTKKGRPALFVFTVATGDVREVAPPVSPRVAGFTLMPPLAPLASLIARDPVGRIWMCAEVDEPDNRGHLRQVVVLLDTKTLTTKAILPHTRYCRDSYDLLGWPDAHTVLMKRGNRILRIDTETFAATVLFPR